VLTLDYEVTGGNWFVRAAESGKLRAHLLQAVASVLNMFAKR
jgi:hypothetical protein